MYMGGEVSMNGDIRKWPMCLPGGGGGGGGGRASWQYIGVIFFFYMHLNTQNPFSIPCINPKMKI